MENDYSGNHQYFDGGSDRHGNNLVHGARTNYTLNKEKSPADVAELFFLAEREGRSLLYRNEPQRAILHYVKERINFVFITYHTVLFRIDLGLILGNHHKNGHIYQVLG